MFFKYSQISPEIITQAQQGDQAALNEVLNHSFQLVYALLTTRKYTKHIKTSDELQSLMTEIKQFIIDRVIPKYTAVKGKFDSFLRSNIQSFLVNKMKKTESELLTDQVIAAQQGDQAAMDYVTQQLDRMIKGIFTQHPEWLWWAQTDEDLEDFIQHLQEYMIRRGIPNYAPERGNAFTYLYQVLRNEIISVGQKKDREQRASEGPLVSLDAPPTDDPDVDEPLSSILADPLTEGIVPFLPQLYETAREHLTDFELTLLDMKLQGMSSVDIVEILLQKNILTPTGKTIDVNWLNVYFNTKIKPVLRQYIFGVAPAQKAYTPTEPEVAEAPPEDFNEQTPTQASTLMLRTKAELDVVTFLRLHLFD